MSEDFEVKPVHDEVVEELERESNLASRVALFTAILSTLGAIFAYRSAGTEVEASALRSQAILLQAQASDSWNYYQAKSQRAYLAKSMARLSADEAVKAEFSKEAMHFEADKGTAEKQARDLENQSHAKLNESEDSLRPHHRLALGMSILQVAVALASITVLTRRKWLFVIAGVTGTAAILTCASAFLI